MANDDTEELRLALVMNGGVSLAVWMGGVTNEVARLTCLHQLDPTYASLLHMTNSTARVDVISGTSAGGVNGAALSVAMLYEGQFSWLRGIWLRMGAFSSLLRQPVGQNPGSLLDGDGYFMPEIEKGLASLAGSRAEPRPAAECPLDLRLTTTLLQGEPGHYVDDLGTPINDVNHRAYFHFQHRTERSTFDPQDQKKTKEAVMRELARAARSTASFPFAFEPSRVDSGMNNTEPLFKGEDGQPLSGNRFVVDGGILDNKPFRGALQAIFSMPRQRGVRRVLAYVNPDPGSDAQNTQARPHDDDADPDDASATPKSPALSRVLTASVLGIPQAQSIADQMRSMEAHNDKVRARRDAILTLVSAFEGAPGRVDGSKIQDLASRLYRIYRTRRLVNTFELFVWPQSLEADARWRAQAASHPNAMPASSAHRQRLGKRQRAWLSQAFMEKTWEKWLPKAWPLSAAASANQADAWQWGMFPVEFSARLLLDVLRRTQVLAWYDEATPRLDEKLSKLWLEANRLTNKLVDLREKEKARWTTGSDAFMNDMPQWQHSLPLAANHLQEQMMAFLEEPERQQFCGEQAHEIARTIWRAAWLARTVVDKAMLSNQLRDHDRARASELALLAHFLAPNALDEPREPAEPEVQEAVYRMLQLEVIEYAFTNHDDLNSDTLIELVQISGDAHSPLGGPSRAADKLLGLQLAHFAAFYKQSWRANDWIYGRLDGSERLVRILLNPERLYRRYTKAGVDALIDDLQTLVVTGRLPGANTADPQQDAQATAHATSLSDTMRTEWRAVDLNKLRSELAFIGTPDLPLPDHLPMCARLITTRLHHDILLDELPELRRAISNDHADGADLGSSCNAVLQGVPEHSLVQPQTAMQLLRNGLISDQRLMKEAGSDLFTRTMGHTLATLQSTMAAKTAKLGPVGTFFATLRLPFFVFYLASQVLTRQTRTQAALHGGLLLAGLAMVLAPMALGLDTDKVPAWWQGLSWAVFATGMVLSLMRTPRTIVLALLVWGSAMVAGQPSHQWLYIGLTVLLLTALALTSRILVSWLAAVGMMLVGAAWSAGYTSWRAFSADFHGWSLPEKMSSSPLIFISLIALVILLAAFESTEWGRRTEAAISRGWRTTRTWWFKAQAWLMR